MLEEYSFPEYFSEIPKYNLSGTKWVIVKNKQVKLTIDGASASFNDYDFLKEYSPCQICNSYFTSK
jgi:hypothetical protein